MEYIEHKMKNGMFMWSPPDVEKPRELTPVEKIAQGKKYEELSRVAEIRQQKCWKCGKHDAYAWVIEVGFDFKGDKADPVKHVAISSGDYPPPVPGFCKFCIGWAPAELAEAVYFDRPEMYWGVRPTRWFVSFTDGTRMGDRIETINPKGELPTIIEEFLPGGRD